MPYHIQRLLLLAASATIAITLASGVSTSVTALLNDASARVACEGHSQC